MKTKLLKNCLRLFIYLICEYLTHYMLVHVPLTLLTAFCSLWKVLLTSHLFAWLPTMIPTVVFGVETEPALVSPVRPFFFFKLDLGQFKLDSLIT